MKDGREDEELHEREMGVMEREKRDMRGDGERKGGDAG